MESLPQITRDELKIRLDRGEPVKLVMAMGEWAYRHAHIPGSLYYSSIRDAAHSLRPDEEVVIYCTGFPCPLGLRMAHILKQKGYWRVRYYPGGLRDWDAAGYPLEKEEL